MILEAPVPGEDGAWWGGEFLLGDYRRFRRVGTFKPVAAPGGPREPWRDLLAHLLAELGWPALQLHFGDLPLVQALRDRAAAEAGPGPAAAPASSCGRLLDAVAAALGAAPGTSSFEGEAALRLEALVDEAALGEDEALAYPFTIPRLKGSGLPYLEPLPMWNAVLGDLSLGTPPGVMAARFHRGLGKAVAAMVRKLAAAEGGVDTVALGGGCFANRVLLGEVVRRLREAGLEVLTPARVPCGGGGLALGQAVVAAARLDEATHS